MTQNYEKLPNGVIKQINREPFNYGFNYSNNYNNLGELGTRMGYLRVGHLIGSLGFIPNTILDVGYGNGDFLKAASNIIPNCYGSDVSNSYPLPDKIKFIDNIFNFESDVITFYDVLEHFDDIYEIKNLKTNYIVVSLPDCHHFSDDWFKSWKHRKPNEHLWHFNKQALTNFMKEIGYEVINLTNIEDSIRKIDENYSNILTGVFKKIKNK